MQDNEYYNILGVSRTASASEIKSRYRKLAFEYHPDRLPENMKEEGQRKMAEINNAYEVLSDPEKRVMYDMYGKDGRAGHDPFGGIFRQMHRQDKPKARPIKILVEMTLEEIYNGKSFSKEIERTDFCDKCDGTGFTDKLDHKCISCDGKGMTVRVTRIGPMIQQIQQPCPSCRGTGSDNTDSEKACKSCNKGIVKDNYTLKFTIPKGYSKEYLIIQNEGNVIPKSKDRGDVHIIIREIEHEVFKRGALNNPLNLFMTLNISLLESLTGVNRVIEYFNGKRISIIDTELIKEGDLKCIPMKGLTNESDSGDLIIQYTIEYPKKLSMNKKKQIYNVLTGKDYDKDFDMSIPKDSELAYLLPVNPNGNRGDEDDHQGVECVHQ